MQAVGSEKRVSQRTSRSIHKMDTSSRTVALYDLAYTHCKLYMASLYYKLLSKLDRSLYG